MTTVHNTPFGDIVDTEDDLQPLVARMFKDAARAVALVAAALDGATFDVEQLEARAGQGWITVTELADTLSRDRGLPFKAAHAIASRVIARATQSPETPIATILRDVATEVAGTTVEYTDAQLAEILSPRHFVEVRKTPGGPAPSSRAARLGRDPRRRRGAQGNACRARARARRPALCRRGGVARAAARRLQRHEPVMPEIDRQIVEQ
jgi:argininosuccinate lyase